MFKRGRIDHLALSVADEAVLEEVRNRLLAVGATSAEIQSFGSVLSLYFEDPDGMALRSGVPGGGERLRRNSTTRTRFTLLAAAT